jgi:hypothetical protein
MKSKSNGARLLKSRARLMAELSGLSGLVRGSLVETMKKCGRKDCECTRGKLHPHRYLSTGVKGKNQVVYVAAGEREAFAQGVKAYERAWQLLCRISAINIRLIREGGTND